MTTQHFILATAGHVDHGKSALIEALTGTHPDRLPEEKLREITIDLGFAHLDLPAPASALPTTSYSLGIVDVPGHEDFVKNMVAGVGSLDLALLVVAADDGWMPQTEEHVQILSYLGVRQAVVALTKVDLASARTSARTEEIRQQLAQSPFPHAPIVPTSAASGLGLDLLKETLTQLLASLPPPRDFGKPRLPVDRVFTLPGIGTVVTGTLTGGTFQRGQRVVLQPSGRACRVRNLQHHNRDVPQCGPGTRTALNLPDVPVASSKALATSEAQGVRRGDVVTIQPLGSASDVLEVWLEKSPRLARLSSPPARPLKDATRIRLHHGSGYVPGRILLWDKNELAPGHSGLAQVRLDRPLFVLAGDRFIVRDWSERWTLAGGIVLDPDAPRSWLRKEAQRRFLETCAAAPDDLSVLARSQLQRDRAALVDTFLAKSAFSVSEIRGILDRLIGVGEVRAVSGWVLDGAWWETVRQRALGAVHSEHRAHPERLGLALTALRAEILELLPHAELFPILVSDLAQRGLVQVGTILKEAAHQPALPPSLQSTGAAMRTALGAKPFEPPSKKDLLAMAQGAQTLRFLLETGEAIDLSSDTVLAAESFVRAKEKIIGFLRQHGAATASQLRQLLPTNRRVIIPLLERLDQESVTLRRGDQRVLAGVTPPASDRTADPTHPPVR